MPARQNLIDGMQQAIAEIRQASVDQPDGRRQDAAGRSLPSRAARKPHSRRSTRGGRQACTLSAMSCRKTVLSAAACSKVSGGTSRVLVRPGADALAMMAMPQSLRRCASNGFRSDRPLQSLGTVHAMPLRNWPRNQQSTRIRTLSTVFGKVRGSAPINSGSPAQFGEHRKVMASPSRDRALQRSAAGATARSGWSRRRRKRVRASPAVPGRRRWHIRFGGISSDASSPARECRRLRSARRPAASPSRESRHRRRSARSCLFCVRTTSRT